MHKWALIFSVMALVLATMLLGVPGQAQTVQQPNVTPPQAEKAAVLLTCPPQTTPQIMSA